MSEMTETVWQAIYQPMPNHLNEGELGYETYGEELEYVLLQDDHNIWTEVDGDDGVYIVNGYAMVNRIKYYITNTAWRDGDNISVPICKFIVCDCFDPNDEETEPDQDCELCLGDGTYTDWMMA
jgi:hypothetical protein